VQATEAFQIARGSAAASKIHTENNIEPGSHFKPAKTPEARTFSGNASG